MKSWSTRAKNILIKEYPIHPDLRILAKRLKRTYHALKSKATELKLKRTYEFWVPAMDATLIELWPNHTAAEVAGILDVSESSLHARAFKLKLYKTKEFKSKMGTYGRSLQSGPGNKGKKQIEFMSKDAIERSKVTRFKKGSVPPNKVPDGTITIRKYHKTKKPYSWIKVNGKWIMHHVFLYEQKHGRIPEGKIVVFNDNDVTNLNIENLICITRAEHMERSRYKDGTIAKYLSGNSRPDKALQEEIRNQPELIELKRQQLILQNKTKKNEQNTKTPGHDRKDMAGKRNR